MQLQHVKCETCGKSLLDYLSKKYGYVNSLIGIPYIKCNKCSTVNYTNKVRYKELTSNQKNQYWIDGIKTSFSLSFILELFCYLSFVFLIIVWCLHGYYIGAQELLGILGISLFLALVSMVVHIMRFYMSLFHLAKDVEKHHTRRINRRKVKNKIRSGRIIRPKNRR